MEFQLPELIPGHRADLAAGIAAMPASRWLGLRVVGFALGVSVLELPVRAELTFDGSSVQGGLVGTLADYAAISAAVSAKPDGWYGTTVNFQVHNLEPARGSKLVAIGRCVRTGARTALGAADVYAFDGATFSLVATGLAGCQYFQLSGA